MSLLVVALLFLLAILPKLEHDRFGGFFISKILLLLAVVFFVFLLFFYRNPTRKLANNLAHDDSLIISPADGKVISIESTSLGHKISIFLSPFNVHVNWAPINGTVQSVTHKAGKFLMAFKAESSELNERNDVHIINNCGSVITRQIAGLLARRIVCWVVPGQKVHLNEKYGMIRFGSRIDLFLPASTILHIRVGERVKGGVTVIGQFSGASKKC